MALDNFTAAVADLQAAANALITKSAADASAVAAAETALANVDSTATAAIQPIIDSLKAAVPAPQPQPDLTA